MTYTDDIYAPDAAESFDDRPMDPFEHRSGHREDRRNDHAKVVHTVGEVYSADSLSGAWTFKDRKSGDIFELDFEGMQNVLFCLELLEAAAIVEVIPDEDNLYFEQVGQHKFADGQVTLYRDPVDPKNIHLEFKNENTTRLLRLLKKKEAKRRNVWNAKVTKQIERDAREHREGINNSVD